MAFLNVIFQFFTACVAFYMVFALLSRHRDERRAEKDNARVVARLRARTPLPRK